MLANNAAFSEVGSVSIEPNGTVHIPETVVPYSGLSSRQARNNFIDMMRRKGSLTTQSREEAPGHPNVQEMRRTSSDRLAAVVRRLRSTFSVTIKHGAIGGVPIDIIEPKQPLTGSSAHRVLISLHGGGMVVGSGNGALAQAIPISAIGRFQVISIDYRMAPEFHFPAASEDVATVYTTLLKSHSPEEIGIFGCSSGAALTAQAVAWFHSHGLPRPGAIGLFGQGAIADNDQHIGDSNYLSSALGGYGNGPDPQMATTSMDYAPLARSGSALLSPAFYPDELKGFPATLLISGTRDLGLSGVVYTHTRLFDVGVDAELHVWEGIPHCAYAVGDPSVPETQQAWRVITGFFSHHLGSSGKTRGGR